MKKTIKVICAVINVENKILVAQRNYNMKLPLKWEFPGGKLEPNETEEECILREIKEELNIDITLHRRLMPSFYEYPSVSIELVPYLASFIGGKIELKDHKQYKLLRKKDLGRLDWSKADIPIVKKLIEL